ASGTTLIVLSPGDRVAVAGTGLQCTVSHAPPRTIVCGIGTASRPTPGSYAFAVADNAALLLKALPSGQPTLVVEKRQPNLTGAGFPLTIKPPRARTARRNTALEVAGTHIVCL